MHGAGECDNEDSYISVVSVPKLGCMDCKKIHEELNADPSECKYMKFYNKFDVRFNRWHIHTIHLQVVRYIPNCVSNAI